MTLINPDARLAKLETDRAHIALTLESMRAQLMDLDRKVQAGEVGTPTEAGKLLNDIRYWLRAARETEAELETVTRQREGITQSYGLDLDRARSEVGCRLARLRACCRAG